MKYYPSTEKGPYQTKYSRVREGGATHWCVWPGKDDCGVGVAAVRCWWCQYFTWLWCKEGRVEEQGVG